MQIEVTTGSETKLLDVDLALDSMTLQESARLEEALGVERWERLMASTDDGTATLKSPTMIRAVIWAKLATLVPGVALNGFDLDLGALAALGPMSVPMETPDGEVTVGEIPAEGGPGN